jgi:DNA-binding HxlR family transcriptional regulator
MTVERVAGVIRLVSRTAHAEVPPRVEYCLTELGTSLLSTVLELAAWSAQRHTEIRRHQDTYDAGGPIRT